MTFICPQCHIYFQVIPDVMNHLILQHAKQNSENFDLRCCWHGCSAKFQRLNDLSNHMHKHLPLPKNENTVYENPVSYEFKAQLPSEIKSKLSPGKIFALELDGSSLPKTTIEFVINKAEILICGVLQEITDFINLDLNRSPEVLKNFVQSKKLVLSDVDSRYKIEKIYDEFPDLVKAKSLYLSTREKQVYDRKAKIYKTINVACNFSYVPVIDTIGFILSTPGIERMQLFKKFPKPNKLVYESIFDGSVFKDGPLYKSHKNIILAGLYYDEFEVVNPLGSKTKIHKIGAFYMTLFNLPDYLNSKFFHTHLVALFKIADLVEDTTINAVIEPIIRDMKLLETNGIKINNCIYKVTIGTVTGDNLGINELLQMVKSFRAEHYCHVCEIDDKTAKYSTEEDTNLLRSPESYDSILAEGLPKDKVHNKGVKQYSLLNNLNYFHTCTNFTADIMHDILEGCLPAAVKLFVKHIINLNIITLEEINQRIFQFNYGVIDKKNKPSPISLSKGGCLLGERAAQNWCLGRYLPLILGDIVLLDAVKDEWKLVSILLEIMDIVFSPRVKKKSLQDLKDLTVTYCKTKIDVYKSPKIPKDHFIEHYATIIERMGPLYFLWCMRHEGKHNYFKDLIQKYQNYICVAQTLTNQHQKYIYNKWRLQYNVFKLVPKYTTQETLMFSALLRKFEFVTNFTEDKEIELCNIVEYGHKYYTGFFIVENDVMDVPSFCKIEAIFIENKTPFCICKKYVTGNYQSNLHAYPIEESEPVQFKIINLSNLTHVNPYETHQAYGNSHDSFIVLKYKF